MTLPGTVPANRLALALAGVVVLAGGAGAAYVAMGGTLPFADDTDATVDTVPEGVDAVVYADPSVVDDGTTEALVNGVIDLAREENPDYDGPADYAALRERVDADAEFELDPAKLHSVVAFARYPETNASSPAGVSDDLSTASYGAAIVDSGWAEADFVAVVENGTVYEEGEYEGYTVYVQQPTEDETPDSLQDTANPTWVGVLADGRYVVGTEAAVTDAIDVHRGAASAFGGRLRTAYDGTRDGYLRFAMAVPAADSLPEGSTSLLTDTQFGAFRNLRTVAGAYYTDGDAIGTQLRLEGGDEDDAEDLKDVLEGVVALTEETMRTEEMESLVDRVAVTREGTTVVVTFESEVSGMLDAFGAAADSWGGLAERAPGPGVGPGPGAGYGSGFDVVAPRGVASG